MRKLEIKGDSLVIYLFVSLAIHRYVLRILGVEGVGLGTHLDVFQLHTIGAVDNDTLLGIVHLHILDADVLYWHLWKTIEVGGTACATADDVVDVDIG